MKMKVVFVMILLMSVFLIGIFFVKISDAVLNSRQELIGYIEKNYNIRIEVGDIAYLPINHLQLINAKISSADNKVKLSASKINIYYDFYKMIFQQKDRWDSINYIKLVKPVLEVDNPDFRETDSQKGWDFLATLSGQINIEDGKVKYRQGDTEIQLDQLSLALNIIKENEYMINLRTALGVKNLQQGDYKIEDFRLDNLNLGLSYSQGRWQGSLQTAMFQLEKLSALKSFFKQEDFTISKLSGKTRLDLNFSGTGPHLEDYNGGIILSAVQGILDIDKLIAGEELSQLQGELIFNSKSKKLVLKDLQFNFADNPYQFTGSLQLGQNKANEIFGILSSENLNLEQPGISLDIPQIKGLARMQLTIMGNIKKPEISLDLVLPQGEIEGQPVYNLRTGLRYYSDNIYLDFLDCRVAEGSYLAVSGIYDTISRRYSLQLQGDKLDSSLFNRYLSDDLNLNLTGQLDTQLAITGQGLDWGQLSLLGKVELSQAELLDKSIDQINSHIWLADNILMFREGAISIANNQLVFNGEVNMLDKRLDIQLAGEKFELNMISTLLMEDFGDLAIMGEGDLQAEIVGKIDDPTITTNLSMAQGQISGNDLENLELEMVYNNSNLDIKSIELASKGANIQGKGYLEITEAYPYLDLDLTAENCNYTLLKEFTGQSLPLRGEFTTKLEVKGAMKSPEIRAELNSDSTQITVANKTYQLDKLSLLLKHIQNNKLEIENMTAYKGDASILAQGFLLADNLSLDITVNDFPLEMLDLEQDILGDVSLTGKIEGEMKDPELTAAITVSALQYQEMNLDRLQGNLIYHNSHLNLQQIKWQSGESSYIISGTLDNLWQNPEFDLKVTTDMGKMAQLLNIGIINYPIPREYFLRGDLELTGNLQEPLAQLDFSFYNEEDSMERIRVTGQVGQQLKLELTGNNVEVSKLSFIEDTGINLKGRLDFNGQVSGPLNSYNLNFNTTLSQGKINAFNLERIEGEIEVSKAELLYLDQILTLEDQSSVSLNGYIPLKEGLKDLKLNIGLTDLPLPLLTHSIKSVPALEGEIAGSVYLEGSLQDPYLTGEIMLKDAGVDLGMFAKFSKLNGLLQFTGQNVVFSDIVGNYGDGKVTLQGKASPFNPEQTYDFKLSGQNLPFQHGSFTGRFNPELTITGSYANPLVKGEFYTHNFVVGVPFSWPLPAEDNNDKLNLDFTLLPGEEVYLKSDDNSINVLVQDGSLNIRLVDGEASFNGKLESEQGSFNYYNNKFLLDSGSAHFREHQGFVPDLDVSASTHISGTIIRVNLNGPADNFLTTFSSSPELTEDEILTLLTSKGGLGDFASGDFMGAIQKEFFRLLADHLQLDLISDLELHLKDIFSLDRVEIDTYNLGWEQEIAVYLGKYLNDKIYLQYSSILQPDERHHELSFRYYLTENLSLEGSWRGEDDYRLSLETNLEF